MGNKKGECFMRKIFKNPIVTFLVGMLISGVLSLAQNSEIDNLLIMIPIVSLVAIFLSCFCRKCEQDWLLYEGGTICTIVLRKGKPELACYFPYQHINYRINRWLIA